MLHLSPARSTWLVRQLARLRHAGAVPVSAWTLPTRTFFPDGFESSKAGFAALASRMLELAGLSFVRGTVGFYDPETGEVAEDDASSDAACGPTGCGSCAPGKTAAPARTAQRDEAVYLDEGAYQLLVGLDAVGSPIVAAARVARAVGAVFLLESDLAREIAPAERRPASELAAISIGLGALVLPAAAMTVRGCGGARVVAATALAAEDLAVAVELTAYATRFDTHALDPLLDEAARRALDGARDLIAANRGVARTLSETPEAFGQGIVHLRPKKSLGDRLTGWLRPRSVDEEIDALESQLAEDARRATAKAP